LIAAPRTTDASQDPFVDQCLQHGLQMTRRQPMSRRKRLRRNWTHLRINSNIDHRCDGQYAFSGQQRHSKSLVTVRSYAA
jgi:hypothetical protein